MELTHEEKRLVLKHRERIEKVKIQKEIYEYILKTAQDYAEWRKNTGIHMSYSSFRHEYEHDKEFKINDTIYADNKFIFETIVKLNETLNRCLGELK